MKSFKELRLWQNAVELSLTIYKLTEHFPAEEKYGIAGQMRRAAVSIPANIAEGWGRGTTREYIQFLRVARGSLYELNTELVIAHRLKYASNEEAGKSEGAIDEIGKMLNRLIDSLQLRLHSKKSKGQ